MPLQITLSTIPSHKTTSIPYQFYYENSSNFSPVPIRTGIAAWYTSLNFEVLWKRLRTIETSVPFTTNSSSLLSFALIVERQDSRIRHLDSVRHSWKSSSTPKRQKPYCLFVTVISFEKTLSDRWWYPSSQVYSNHGKIAWVRRQFGCVKLKQSIIQY